MDTIELFTWTGFKLGPIFIHSWGIMAALGVLVGIYLAGKKRKYLGLSENSFLSFIIGLVISVFLGARLLYIIEMPSYYFNNPAAIYMIWQGGFSMFGGILGGVLFGGFYSKVKKINWRSIGWMITPAWIVGIAFGRVGCSLIHDHLGKPTDLPIGVSIGGKLRHEIALYEILVLILVYLIILRWQKLEKRIRIKHTSSIVFPLSLLLYTIGRFWLDFLREGSLHGGDSRYWGITLAQHLAIISFTMSTYFILERVERWGK